MVCQPKAAPYIVQLGKHLGWSQVDLQHVGGGGEPWEGGGGKKDLEGYYKRALHRLCEGQFH